MDIIEDNNKQICLRKHQYNDSINYKMNSYRFSTIHKRLKSDVIFWHENCVLNRLAFAICFSKTINILSILHC